MIFLFVPEHAGEILQCGAVPVVHVHAAHPGTARLHMEGRFLLSSLIIYRMFQNVDINIFVKYEKCIDG